VKKFDLEGVTGRTNTELWKMSKKDRASSDATKDDRKKKEGIS